jgi:hypothetical protein
MNARNITIFGSIAILGLGGYFVYKYLRNKKIDERVVTESEALEMLEEAKLEE